MTIKERQEKKTRILMIGDYTDGMSVVLLAKKYKLTTDEVLEALAQSGVHIDIRHSKKLSDAEHSTQVRNMHLEAQVARLKDDRIKYKNSSDKFRLEYLEYKKMYETEKARRIETAKQLDNYRKHSARLEERLTKRASRD